MFIKAVLFMLSLYSLENPLNQDTKNKLKVKLTAKISGHCKMMNVFMFLAGVSSGLGLKQRYNEHQFNSVEHLK